MKRIALLLAFFSTLAAGSVIVAGGEPSGEGEPERPVRIAFTTDLVKDFPVAVAATTAEDWMRFTLGPKDDGYYCSIEVVIDRREDGSAKITTTFAEETPIMAGENAGRMRTVGFDGLSVVLSPGEEEVIFASGDGSFVVGMPEAVGD